MPQLPLHDVDLFYEVLGDGEPVALLNGVAMTTQSWVLQTRVLRRRYRLLLHDFRGQLASPLRGAAEIGSLERHADDLAALLDHLDVPSCHLVGTSYGGEVGMIFAAARPERVRSLSVIASVSRVGPLLAGIVTSWAEAAAARPEAFYRLMAPAVFSERFLSENPDTVRQGEERLRQAPESFFRDFPKLVEAFLRLDLRDRLPAVTAPTLVVCGTDDVLKPVTYSREIAAAVAGAEMLVVPGAGHAVVLERPQEVNTALIGFIEKHRSG